MAEFGMKKTASYQQVGMQEQVPYQSQASAYPPPSGGVDWYTPSSSAYTAYQESSSAGYGGASGYMGSQSGFTGAPGANFEDEAPLLEELGIDLGGIINKTRCILLYQLNNRTLDDLDMGGALMFVFLLGGLHLLMGKLHFGIVLGWSVVHSAVLWFLVNQLAGIEAAEARGLDLYSVCCLVGYCMAPIAAFSAASLMLPKGPLPVLLGVLSTLWGAHTASRIFARRCTALEEAKFLVMLPCVLMYAAFALLTLY